MGRTALGRMAVGIWGPVRPRRVWRRRRQKVSDLLNPGNRHPVARGGRPAQPQGARVVELLPYGTRARAYRAADHHVADRVRSFLSRRRQGQRKRLCWIKPSQRQRFEIHHDRLSKPGLILYGKRPLRDTCTAPHADPMYAVQVVEVENGNPEMRTLPLF